jgi:Holliday junction resolvase
MKNFLLITLILFSFSFVIAQDKGNANGFTAKHTTSGNVTIKKGKVSGVINLAREVSGCVYTSRQAVKDAPTECASFGAKAVFKIIDAVSKNGKHYLIIETESPSGNSACNACGRCGADGATSLIWVKLNARLKVEEKKSIPISDCEINTYLTENKEINRSIMDGKGYRFIKNRLRIETKGRSDVETKDKNLMDEIIIWNYSRNSAEKGFTIEKKTLVED